MVALGGVGVGMVVGGVGSDGERDWFVVKVVVVVGMVVVV